MHLGTIWNDSTSRKFDELSEGAETVHYPQEWIMKMRFFISGIMKGELISEGLHDQSYRSKLSDLLKEVYPDADISGFYDLYPDGAEGIEQQAFFELIKQAAFCDVVIVFLPKASMGSAIEMWEAFKQGKVILTVSPLVRNWTVKYLSSRVFDTVQSLEFFLRDGGLQDLLAKRRIE